MAEAIVVTDTEMFNRLVDRVESVSALRSKLTRTLRGELLTIPDVARRAGVSKSTVWADIHDRRLPVTRKDGRTFVDARCLTTYRLGTVKRAELLTYTEAAAMVGLSVRTLRRCADSYRIVRESPRRVYIHVSSVWCHRVLGQRREPVTFADTIARIAKGAAEEWRSEEKEARQQRRAERRSEEQRARDRRRVARELVELGRSRLDTAICTVGFAARVALTTTRDIHHDIAKQAIAAEQRSRGARYLIRPIEIARYAATRHETGFDRALVPEVSFRVASQIVRCFGGDPEHDAASRAAVRSLSREISSRVCSFAPTR